jgi:hypothetical protein
MLECMAYTEVNNNLYRVDPAYNSIGLCDTSPIASYILWNQLIPHC